MTVPTIRFAIVLCGLGVAFPALAGDVRAQLTPDLIYSHCQAAGVGSQSESTFMLPGGRVTGSVLCTDADLATSNMAPAYRSDDDDRDDQKGRGNKNDHADDREDGDDD